MIHFIGDPSLVEDTEIQHSSMEALTEWLQDKKVIAIDTETEGLFDFENKVIMLQLGDIYDQFVIDTRVTNIDALKGFFEDSSITKLFWNAKFDVNFLRFTFGFITEGVFDCFLAECLLNAGKENIKLSLEAAALKYCNKQLDKAQRSKFVGLNGQPFTFRQIKYGAEDVQLLHTIKDQQMYELTKLNCTNVIRLENKSILALADIEYNGMRLDPKKWLTIADQTEANRHECIKRLDSLVLSAPRLSRFVPEGVQGNLFGYEERHIQLNYKSPDDKVAVLEALGIDLGTSNANEIFKYRDEPFVAALLEYSKQNKLADAFGRNFLDFINPITGRIHQDVWPIVSTGRMSSRKPNMTNIPSKGALAKAIRAAFIPEAGNVFVGGDFSGAELRIIAEGSQDPVWLEAFRNDEDLHSKLACLTFGIDMSEVKSATPFKPDVTYRDVQKTVNFGLA